MRPADSLQGEANAASQPLSENTAVRHFRALVRHSDYTTKWIAFGYAPSVSRERGGRILIATSRRSFVVHFAHAALAQLGGDTVMRHGSPVHSSCRNSAHQFRTTVIGASCMPC